ncbi:sialate O-acetylesterase [Clavibacter sp. Sh2141]|uniref:sialate O-acetylesterase n=1 Tax=Clavibacter sp. Sh2141 TaxID=3395374 RepID=UPI0039BD4A67
MWPGITISADGRTEVDILTPQYAEMLYVSREDFDAAVSAASMEVLPDGGYDIVVVMGQSNAQGAAVDFTPGTAPDVDPGRVLQYGAFARDNVRRGAGKPTRAADPLIHPWTQVAADGSLKPTKGLGMPFARRYVPALAAGRRLLLVPAAYSGTGFNKTNHGTELSTHWRPGDNTGVNLYERAIAQTLAAKRDAGPNARIVGAIWMQGETDEVTPASAYRDYLLALIDGFRQRVGVAELPFVIGGMVPEGLVNNAGRAAIDAVHREIPSLRTFTAFGAGPSGKFIDSGLHYSAAGQESLGSSIYDAYVAAKANVPVAPGQVTGVTAGAPGSKSVPLSWSPVNGATSYEVQRKPSSSTSWTAVATVTGTSTTAGSLTAEVAYDFRVRAVNAGGNGTYSALVSATTTAAGQVLSDLSVPVARAYGLRRLHAAYSGPAIRVVRTTDGAEMDVPFTSGGDLDTAAVLAWTPANGVVLITRFYDLTGGGRHLTQGTQSRMARLVNGGALDAVGGKAAPVANVDTYYSGTFTGPSLYARGASTTCAVVAGAAAANGRLLSETSSTSISPQYAPIMASAANGAVVSQRITDDAGLSVAPDTGTVAGFLAGLSQITSTDTGSAFVKRANGADAGTVAYTRSGALTLDTFTWGGLFRNGATFNGAIGTRPVELVVFATALSATDRSAVEASQKAYFGTP